MTLSVRWKAYNERERRWKRYRSDLMETGSFVPTLDMVCPRTALAPHSHRLYHSSAVFFKFENDEAITACKREHTRKDMISNVEKFTRHMQQASLSLAEYAMQFFTFVPDPTGYVTVLHKTDGSLTRCAWHNVPEKLDKLLERVATKGVRRVTVGGNGSFVVLMNTGELWWSHVPESLHRLLDGAKKSGRAVAVSVITFPCGG